MGTRVWSKIRYVTLRTLPLRTGPREQGLDAGILDADGRVLCYVGWDDAAEVIGRLTEAAS